MYKIQNKFLIVEKFHKIISLWMFLRNKFIDNQKLQSILYYFWNRSHDNHGVRYDRAIQDV
jgi:hypothetical protein